MISADDTNAKENCVEVMPNKAPKRKFKVSIKAENLHFYYLLC